MILIINNSIKYSDIDEDGRFTAASALNAVVVHAITNNLFTK